MAEIFSNTFTTNINKVIVAETDKNTQIIIMKNKVELTAVNSAPTTGQYRVTIAETKNCTARLENDYKTITLLTATGNSGEIKLSIDIEGKKTISKTIPVASITSSSTISTYYSEQQQLANKFTWLVKSGTSSSNMELTDELFNLVSNNITLTADNINLEGYTTINGNFSVDASGTMSCTNANISGTLNGCAINGSTINGSEITSNGSNNDRTYINGGFIECSGTINRYWLGNNEGNQTIKLKSENGKFRARNDSYNRSVYFSDQGLSTTADGELGSSGIIDFHNDWYGYGNKGITMYSNHHVGLVSYNGYVNISPEWNNTGNNTFSFQVFDASSGGASDTDGLIYYGSHKTGYSTVLRISKDANDPYLQVLNSSLGSDAKLMAEYVKTTMVNNNYFTNGTLTINQDYQGVQGGTQTYLSGTAVSATKFYQNGSTVTGSDIVLKDNIKEYEGNALDIISKTKVYSFNRIADSDITEIGFVAQQVPDELLYKKGDFTKEELDGLTAEEKVKLLDKKIKSHIEDKKIELYEKLAKKYPSFHDLDDKSAEAQINSMQEEINELEFEAPISMINQNNIIAIMFKAIQELKSEIDKLKKG